MQQLSVKNNKQNAIFRYYVVPVSKQHPLQVGHLEWMVHAAHCMRQGFGSIAQQTGYSKVLLNMSLRCQQSFRTLRLQPKTAERATSDRARLSLFLRLTGPVLRQCKFMLTVMLSSSTRMC